VGEDGNYGGELAVSERVEFEESSQDPFKVAGAIVFAFFYLLELL
jgi:hypothetical protein